ncbi:MAG: hypothetical protein Q8P51_04705 [Ignavibacteria bacterium]|nr:hypothetical protein [Ignavibacteria bacterium]
MANYFYAHKKTEEIVDEDLQSLFNEIAELRNVSRSGMVIQFLHQALDPFPPMKGKKFSKLELLPGSLLLKKVRDVAKTEIYKLCIDLAMIAKIGTIENHNNLTLFGLLNKISFTDDKSKKRVRR